MNKLTWTLGTVIKPSVPTETPVKSMWDHAKKKKKRQTNTISIVSEHHQTVITGQFVELLALPNSECQLPFQVATNWARCNLDGRFLPVISKQTENLLMSEFTDGAVAATTRLQQCMDAFMPAQANPSASPLLFLPRAATPSISSRGQQNATDGNQ